MDEQLTDERATAAPGDGALVVASPAWDRLEQQIAWYDRESTQSQRWFKGLKIVQIVTAAAIPVAAAASAPLTLLGAGGRAHRRARGPAAAAAVPGELDRYRSTCERLRAERFLYLSRAGPYAAAAAKLCSRHGWRDSSHRRTPPGWRTARTPATRRAPTDDAGSRSRSELPEPKVFISYRRQETSAYAGRLYDSMAAAFGDANVFMDVDLAPGIDFVDRITNAVSACHVLIVVMGPRWATVTDEDGGVRIADAEDFVRLEVGTALRRSDVTVIPVLVSGARMPDGDDLPSDLRPLTRRNALELSDGRWRDDVRRLRAGWRNCSPGPPRSTAVAPHRNGGAAAESSGRAAPAPAVRGRPGEDRGRGNHGRGSDRAGRGWARKRAARQALQPRPGAQADGDVDAGRARDRDLAHGPLRPAVDRPQHSARARDRRGRVRARRRDLVLPGAKALRPGGHGARLCRPRRRDGWAHGPALGAAAPRNRTRRGDRRQGSSSASSSPLAATCRPCWSPSAP